MAEEGNLHLPFFDTNRDVDEALSVLKSQVGNGKSLWPPGFDQENDDGGRVWPPVAITGDAMVELAAKANTVQVLGKSRHRIHPRKAGSIIATNILPRVFSATGSVSTAGSTATAFMDAASSWVRDDDDAGAMATHEACFVAYLNMVFKCGFGPLALMNTLATKKPSSLLQLGLTTTLVAGTVLASGVGAVDELMSGESGYMMLFLLSLYNRSRDWLYTGFKTLIGHAHTRELMGRLVASAYDKGATPATSLKDVFLCVIASAGALRVIQRNPLIADWAATDAVPAYTSWFPEFTCNSSTGKQGLLVMNEGVAGTFGDDEERTGDSVCVSSLKAVMTSGIESAKSKEFADSTGLMVMDVPMSSIDKAKKGLKVVMDGLVGGASVANMTARVATHNLLVRAVQSLSGSTTGVKGSLFEVDAETLATVLKTWALRRLVDDGSLFDSDPEFVTRVVLALAVISGASPSGPRPPDLDKAIVDQLIHMKDGARSVWSSDGVTGVVCRDGVPAALKAVFDGSGIAIPQVLLGRLTKEELLSLGHIATLKTSEDLKKLFPATRTRGSTAGGGGAGSGSGGSGGDGGVGGGSVDPKTGAYWSIITDMDGGPKTVSCRQERKQGDDESKLDYDGTPLRDGRRVATPFFPLPEEGGSTSVAFWWKGATSAFATFVLDAGSMCVSTSTVSGQFNETGAPAVARYEVLHPHAICAPRHKDDIMAETGRDETDVLFMVSSQGRTGVMSMGELRETAMDMGRAFVRVIVMSTIPPLTGGDDDDDDDDDDDE